MPSMFSQLLTSGGYKFFEGRNLFHLTASKLFGVQQAHTIYLLNQEANQLIKRVTLILSVIFCRREYLTYQVQNGNCILEGHQNLDLMNLNGSYRQEEHQALDPGALFYFPFH